MKTGIRDWGLGIRKQRSEIRGQETAVLSSLSTIHYPLSTVSFRRGISLMEVLISVFILSIGLLGVAAMIPIGKLAMIETAKSDRTGACGRAALREVKVRRMMNPTNWSTPSLYTSTTPFVIDPLGFWNVSNTFGPLTRINYAPGGTQLTKIQADYMFRWNDDLLYALPKDMTSNAAATEIKNGERPMGVFTNSSFSSTSTTLDATYCYPVSEGNYSWFLTVAPQIVNSINTGAYTVAAVVCYKRVLASTSEVMYSGVSTMTTPPTYGGVGIKFTQGATMPKMNEWVLLYGSQCTWYRVVSVGVQSGNTAYAMLVGPDWYGNSSGIQMVVVPGITGVYTTTVQLDNDKIWTR